MASQTGGTDVAL